MNTAFSFDMSYCGTPPTLADVWGRWNFEPVLLTCLALLAAFGLLRLQGSGRRFFLSAWFIATVLFVSPICAMSVALFSVRVSHHVALTMMVAPLLALALPRHWAERGAMPAALVVSTMALWLWHTPDLYKAAFQHPAIYWAMQLSLLGSFTWLWLGLLRGPSTMSAGVTALTSAIQMGFLGALLVFAPSPLYLPHLATSAGFGLLPLEDQQLAGVVMWVPANLPLMAVLIWRLSMALRPTPAGQTR